MESKDVDVAVKKLIAQVQELQKERDTFALERNELKDKLTDMEMEYERMCEHMNAMEKAAGDMSVEDAKKGN